MLDSPFGNHQMIDALRGHLRPVIHWRLTAAGFTSVEALLRARKWDVLKLMNIGPKKLLEIERALEAAGYGENTYNAVPVSRPVLSERAVRLKEIQRWNNAIRRRAKERHLSVK